jgi:hypothetical protein
MKRLTSLVLFTLCSSILAADKPNILFILADDLGQRDIRAFNSDTFYDTPNIDSLAKRGMKFTSGYAACCVCSPTRGSIMTGKYPPRFGITNFIPGGRAGKLLPAANANELALSEITIAEVFKEAGYATSMSGKWHLGNEGFLAKDQGFTTDASAATGPKTNAEKRANDPKKTDRICDDAIAFIQENKDRPFFAYLPFNASPRAHRSPGRPRHQRGRKSPARPSRPVGPGRQKPSPPRPESRSLRRHDRTTRLRHRPDHRFPRKERPDRQNHRRLHVRQLRPLHLRRLPTSNLTRAPAKAGPIKAACANPSSSSPRAPPHPIPLATHPSSAPTFIPPCSTSLACLQNPIRTSTVKASPPCSKAKPVPAANPSSGTTPTTPTKAAHPTASSAMAIGSSSSGMKMAPSNSTISPRPQRKHQPRPAATGQNQRTARQTLLQLPLSHLCSPNQQL